MIVYLHKQVYAILATEIRVNVILLQCLGI